jgi:IS30 family transposase
VERPLTAQDRDEIWDLVMAGGTHGRVGLQVGRSTGVVHGVIASTGGVRPAVRCRGADRLSVSDREDIACGVAAGLSARAIALGLRRAPSRVSRELNRNDGRGGYRPSVADQAAWDRAGRPKPCKLAVNLALREHVIEGLKLQWSPEQIAGWLTVEFPDDPELRVSYETIYLSLFVQAKGLLHKELTKELRSRRGVRRAGRISVRGQGRGQIVDALHISERLAEADDRAVPGHWEGDMVSGSGNPRRDAGGALEPVRVTGEAREQDHRLRHRRRHREHPGVARAAQEVADLGPRLGDGQAQALHRRYRYPGVLLRSKESLAARDEREHQRLIRQYLPHGMSFKDITQDQLDEIADRLNGRPRKTLGYMTPSAKLSELLQ